MTLLDKYTSALNTIPAPGGGGCHTALLGVANLGVMAGLTDQQIFDDMRNSIPAGGRQVRDNEIIEAIKRSRTDTAPFEAGEGYKPLPVRPKPRPAIKPEYLQCLLEQGAGITEQDLRNASPKRLNDTPFSDALLLLKTLYSPDDVLFIGTQYDKAVKPVREWIRQIKEHGTAGLPHVIPNPLTGRKHPTKSGTQSYRCDAAVKDYRYAVVEFDDISREDQLAFWAAIPLPVAALIDSGGKSIHGWIKVDGVTNEDEWTQQVEIEMYARRLIPLGVDPACKNEARLSRLAGHLRKEKERWQRLLYLNPYPTSAPILAGTMARLSLPKRA